MTDQINAPDDFPADSCKRSERAERILEKMESLEMIAAGVSHDMNNILSGIVTYPEVLLMRKDLDEKTRKALRMVQESGERVAALISDLTTITRDNIGNWEKLSLNDLVEDYLNSPEYRKLQLGQANIAVRTSLAENLTTISASRIHLRKALMHLVSTAAQNIGSDGEITISTAVRRLDQLAIPQGTYALLSVADTAGIPKVHVDHLFEPFYTRKVMGRNGTGLEFPLVWHTVRDHNGHINVAIGANFARFDLYFPETSGK